jgi:hypothetical protein
MPAARDIMDMITALVRIADAAGVAELKSFILLQFLLD